MKMFVFILSLFVSLSVYAAPKDEDENPPLKQSDLPLPIVVDQSQGDVPVTLDGETVTVTGSVDATIQEPLEVVSDAVLKFTYPNNFVHHTRSLPFAIVSGGYASPGTKTEVLLLQSQFEYMTGFQFDAGFYKTDDVIEPMHFKISFVGYDENGVLEWTSKVGAVLVHPGHPVSYKVEFPMPLSTLGYYQVGLSIAPGRNTNVGHAILTTEINLMGYKDLPQ